MRKIRFLLCILVVLAVAVAQGQNWVNTKHVVPDSLFDGMALTPPMGWNSWNCFEQQLNEQVIREIADMMVSSGIKDAGYEYIVLDDGWQSDRDEDGNIIADPDKFPSGMKSLVDYVHSKGLKFGLYSDAGTNTCGGNPGSRGYEFQDALQYARWGVDFLKYDWCHHGDMHGPSAYLRMHDAIKNSGRPIMLSICEWGKASPWTWGAGIGQMWRVSSDLFNVFEGRNEWGAIGVVNVVDIMANLNKFAGPGHWNDADMLQVGNRGLSEEENRSHFSMWCMLASPLFAGNDLRNMSASTLDILTNKEAIAINQDKLGKQAIRYMDYGEHEIWIKPLENGDMAVCFFNRDANPWSLNYLWEDCTYIVKGKVYKIRDLWQHKDLGDTSREFDVVVPSHGVVLLRLSEK